MKESWFKVASRYDALLLRERWLIAVALLGGIVLIGYSLFVEPALQRAQLAERSVTEQSAQLSALQAQVIALQSPEQDPDVAARAELDDLKKQLGELASRLSILEQFAGPPATDERFAGGHDRAQVRSAPAQPENTAACTSA